jgi:hypothetical protein
MINDPASRASTTAAGGSMAVVFPFQFIFSDSGSLFAIANSFIIFAITNYQSWFQYLTK